MPRSFSFGTRQPAKQREFEAPIPEDLERAAASLNLA
jgi:hypothetical protein